MKKFIFLSILFSFSFALAQKTTSNYYPLKVGYQWTYKMPAQRGNVNQIVEVAKYELGAFHVKTTFETGEGVEIEDIIETKGNKVFKTGTYGGLTKEGWKFSQELLIQYPLKVGSSWKQGDNRETEYDVESIVDLTVEAGEFHHVCKIKKYVGSPFMESYIYLAPNVGLIKEELINKDESTTTFRELTNYKTGQKNINPPSSKKNPEIAEPITPQIPEPIQFTNLNWGIENDIKNNLSNFKRALDIYKIEAPEKIVFGNDENSEAYILIQLSTNDWGKIVNYGGSVWMPPGKIKVIIMAIQQILISCYRNSNHETTQFLEQSMNNITIELNAKDDWLSFAIAFSYSENGGDFDYSRTISFGRDKREYTTSLEAFQISGFILPNPTSFSRSSSPDKALLESLMLAHCSEN